MSYIRNMKKYNYDKLKEKKNLPPQAYLDLQRYSEAYRELEQVRTFRNPTLKELEHMNYDEMINDAMTIQDENYKKFRHLSLCQGIHLVRVIPFGNPPEYSKGIKYFYRPMVRHEWGKEKNFRAGLCWDYIMDNQHTIAKYLIDQKKLTKEDAQLASKYGCPLCSSTEYLIKTANVPEETIKKIIKLANKNLINVWYLKRAYPEEGQQPTALASGRYIWSISPQMLKKLVMAIAKDIKVEEIEDPISLTQGRNVCITATGEGIMPPNRREYTVEMKGKVGPMTYRSVDGSEILTFKNIEQIEPYNLVEVEASNFMTYQQAIDVAKKLFGHFFGSLGYEVPGDRPSDNPLDDNYQAPASGKAKTALDSLNEYEMKESAAKPKSKADDDWLESLGESKPEPKKVKDAFEEMVEPDDILDPKHDVKPKGRRKTGY